jgi:hypothetical protein
MKVKRQSKVLRLTRDYLVVNCSQQRVLGCRKCDRETLIEIASHSLQLRWCSHCASQLLMTTFDEAGGNPTRSWRDIKKWVDNGSVQLIETPETTFIITFEPVQRRSAEAGQTAKRLINKEFT